MDFNEALRDVIKNTLENANSLKVAAVLKLLKDLGVEKHQHLKFVQESDLTEHMNKIQARMLLESFKNFSGSEIVQYSFPTIPAEVTQVSKDLIAQRPDSPDQSSYAFSEADNTNIQTYEAQLSPEVVLPDLPSKEDLPNLPSKEDLPNLPPKEDLPDSPPQEDFPDSPPQEDFPDSPPPQMDHPYLAPQVVLHELPSSSFLSIESNDDMNISWHLLGARVVHNLENGKEISQSEFRNMVRIIVDDVMKAHSNPTKKVLNKVAQQCVTKYPVLKDKFSSVTLGSGYENLAYRLVTRLENVKRTPRQSDDYPPVKKRRFPNDSYGCVAWEGELPKGMTKEELISKKNVMSQLNKESEMNKAIKLLEETYYLQRVSINYGNTIEDLLNEWPVLFTEQGIKSHFKILTNICLYETLEVTVSSKGKNILSFWRTCDNKEVKALMAEADQYNEAPNQLLLLVLTLGTYFKESFSAVFFTDKVFDPDNLSHLPKYPCLVGKGTSILKCEEFMLVVDGIAVNTTFKDPKVAVACWFASYFIFNRMYPIEFSCSLEFFQRCLVGINPSSGSKVERRKDKRPHCGVHPKILKLLQKLNDFEGRTNDVCKSRHNLFFRFKYC